MVPHTSVSHHTHTHTHTHRELNRVKRLLFFYKLIIANHFCRHKFDSTTMINVKPQSYNDTNRSLSTILTPIDQYDTTDQTEPRITLILNDQ